MKIKTGRKPLELYIHIPFCVKKCAYCDFLSFPEFHGGYIPALLEEIKAPDSEGADLSGRYVTSVFIGGGTPSILPGDDIYRIMEAVGQSFLLEKGAEITIEANPGTLTEEKLKAYRAAGINRLSIGLQSSFDEDLKRLGRIHRYRDFTDNYRLARESGFDNINIDLMSALPGQTPDSWRKVLLDITALSPEHISAYSLIIEEGTPFYEQCGKGILQLPGEEEERQMYYDTKAILSDAGYSRYEISNYSRPGRECRHNIGYWQRWDYIGFGLGASSMLDNKRFANGCDLQEYIEAAGKGMHGDIQRLSVREQMEERMFLGLRLTEGVCLRAFEKSFGTGFTDIYEKAVSKLTEEGLLIVEGGYARLTERGMDVSNYAMAEFLL